jgi:hypothetical protein
LPRLKRTEKVQTEYIGAGTPELIQEINGINTPDVALAP